MAFAKTLTTPTGGGFVFQPAEPRRRFPQPLHVHRLAGYTQGDQTDAGTTLRPEVSQLSSVLWQHASHDTRVESSVG